MSPCGRGNLAHSGAGIHEEIKGQVAGSEWLIPFLMKGKTPKDMWSHQLLKDIGWPAWLQKGQVTLRGVGVGGLQAASTQTLRIRLFGSD